MAETLAQLIRAKFPGAYDDLDDAALEAAWLAKYPGAYEDLPRSKTDQAPGPAPWTAQFPKSAQLVRGGLDALPGIGGIAGFAVAGPETAGLAAVPAVALGTGIGRGVRDLIAHMIGLDPPDSPLAKGGRIALNTAEAAATQAILPGLWEAIRTPGKTVGEVFEILPRRFRPYLPPGLERAPARVLQRPAWQTWESSTQHLDTSVPVRPSALTPEQLAERIRFGTTPVVPAAPPSGLPAASPVAPSMGAPPVTPAPAAVPAPPIATPRAAVSGPASWSAQRIQNELGLAARRAKVKLTDDQYEQAAALVREGHPPTAAVTRVAGPAAPPSVPKVKVSAAEVQAYQNYRRAGKTHEEAMALVELQRKLAESLGLPSSETVRQSVAGRNIAGEWTK